ncbi:DUF4339 domain-containing protein [[Roseibacterium] beibuensis]|uniref:GYF domain-containing protein n=1 Tax=[Roseibacterium] beibuensis TaxID=1193142 RepID=A0ABP9LQ03_9RHOB|nr:GYF domain-containing protein [Roseibacterium beibuensis]
MNDDRQDGALPATRSADAPPTAPPHPLDGQWFMRVDGRDYGPYTGHQLKAFAEDGRLEPDTEIRREASAEWVAAEMDVAIRKFFQPAPVPQPGPEPQVATASDRSTVVQVTNTFQQPAALVDPGANKSPGLALLLSFLFVGLGQFYNGDVGKGFLMILGCILLWLVFLGWIINIWSMIDAYTKAKELRDRHQAYIAAQTRPA